MGICLYMSDVVSIGRYGNTSGLTNASCSGDCEPGYVCPRGSSTSRVSTCGNATVFCPSGAASPLTVPPGWYSTPESASVTTRSGASACSPGEFCTMGTRYSSDIIVLYRALRAATVSASKLHRCCVDQTPLRRWIVLSTVRRGLMRSLSGGIRVSGGNRRVEPKPRLQLRGPVLPGRLHHPSHHSGGPLRIVCAWPVVVDACCVCGHSVVSPGAVLHRWRREPVPRSASIR
jgi:hypothetical protein